MLKKLIDKIEDFSYRILSDPFTFIVVVTIISLLW